MASVLAEKSRQFIAEQLELEQKPIIAKAIEQAIAGDSKARDFLYPLASASPTAYICRMTRAEKVRDIRRRCIRANEGVLWDDHGNVLMRVSHERDAVQGFARPTKLMLADVLKTWEWVYEKTADRREDDEDAARAYKEIAAQIEALWDEAADDLMMQSDRIIDLSAEHLLVDIPRAKPKRT